MKASFNVTLRGVECEVEGNVCPPEPDVGIMSSYMDDWHFIDPQEANNWELTDEEVEKVNEAFDDWHANGDYLQDYDD